MGQTEEKYVRETIRKLRLKPRKGRFMYFDRPSGKQLTFDWDGAGVDANHLIVLIEAEIGEISDWHIQTHISRLAVMINQGTPIKKIVWITNQGTFQVLKNIIDSWLAFFNPVCRIALPFMEYRTPNGELLNPSASYGP